MNFKYFERLLIKNTNDDIQVIGKDIKLDGCDVHLIGMSLKGKKVYIYGLEIVENTDVEEETFQAISEKTHRQQMRESCENSRNFIFLGIREFYSDGKVYQVAGASSSRMEHYNMPEHMLFYLNMKKNGWNISEEAPLYTTDWKYLQLSTIELKDEMEELPDWGAGLEIVRESQPKTSMLEVPIVLVPGETPVILFQLEDGTKAECYINKICLKDIWADHDQRFTDEKYINRMLEYVSMEEIQEMKKKCEEALLMDCPRGKCYMLIEYECSIDIVLNFYAVSFLDSKPSVHSGSTTSLLIMHRPDTNEGAHGKKLRSCIIQTPLESDVVSLKAELFSYTETIKQYREKVIV